MPENRSPDHECYKKPKEDGLYAKTYLDNAA